MTRDQLEHAIRAACDVADDQEVWVFGSQALLASYPEAPESLRASVEVDVQPKNKPEMVDRIDGVLGELSQFHETHGFYVHGVSLESAALPRGWEERVIPVMDEVGTRGATGLCVEIHDLAASKLAAFRPKDLEFARLLIVENMIDVVLLQERVKQLDVDGEIVERVLEWLSATYEEIHPDKAF